MIYNVYTFEEYKLLSEIIGNPDSILKTVIDHTPPEEIGHRIKETFEEYGNPVSLGDPVYWQAKHALIYLQPLREMPLFLHDERGYFPEIARWRLRINK